VVDLRLAFLIIVFTPVVGAAAFGIEWLATRRARGALLRRPSRRAWVSLSVFALTIYLLGVVPDVAMQFELRSTCHSGAYTVDPIDKVCRRGGTSTTDWHQPGDYVVRREDFHAALRLTTLPVRLFALDFTSSSYHGFGICVNTPRDCE
jgi:hypothetical protein